MFMTTRVLAPELFKIPVFDLVNTYIHYMYQARLVLKAICIKLFQYVRTYFDNLCNQTWPFYFYLLSLDYIDF